MGMAPKYITHPKKIVGLYTLLGTITYPLLKALLSLWDSFSPGGIYAMHSNSEPFAKSPIGGYNKAWGPWFVFPAKKMRMCCYSLWSPKPWSISNKTTWNIETNDLRIFSRYQTSCLMGLPILNKHTHHKFLTDCKQPRSLAHKRLEAQVTCSFLTIPREEHMTKSKGVGHLSNLLLSIWIEWKRQPYIHIYIIHTCTSSLELLCFVLL